MIPISAVECSNLVLDCVGGGRGRVTLRGGAEALQGIVPEWEAGLCWLANGRSTWKQEANSGPPEATHFPCSVSTSVLMEPRPGALCRAHTRLHTTSRCWQAGSLPSSPCQRLSSDVGWCPWAQPVTLWSPGFEMWPRCPAWAFVVPCLWPHRLTGHTLLSSLAPSCGHLLNSTECVFKIRIN